MSWRRALEQVLKRGNLVRFEEETEVVLRELGPNVDMKRTIVETPRTAATVSMKNVDHPSFVGGRDWRQRCDGLIFVRWNGTNHVVLIELKRTLRGEGKPFDQLVHTGPIVEYLAAIGQLAGAPAGRLRWSPVVLVERLTHLDKQPVRIVPGQPVETREHRGMHIRVFSGARLRFADLVAPEFRRDQT